MRSSRSGEEDREPVNSAVTAMEPGQSAQGADMVGEHSPGVCVLERVDACSPGPPPRQRSLRVVYVLNDGLKAVMASSPESGALHSLQRACDAESALLTTVTFGRLDFGETSVLDTFYDAGRCGARPNTTLKRPRSRDAPTCFSRRL